MRIRDVQPLDGGNNQPVASTVYFDDGSTVTVGVTPATLTLDDVNAAVAALSPADPHPLVGRLVGPDPGGWMEAVVGAFGFARVDAWMAAHPTTIRALDRGAWVALRYGIADALARETLTQQEHDTLQVLLTEYRIPEAP